jgi:uncharacterized protein YbjT (DUF2867 family)
MPLQPPRKFEHLAPTAWWPGENLLRKSGVPYTVVRPGGLTNGPALTEALVVSAHPDAIDPRCSGLHVSGCRAAT